MKFFAKSAFLAAFLTASVAAHAQSGLTAISAQSDGEHVHAATQSESVRTTGNNNDREEKSMQVGEYGSETNGHASSGYPTETRFSSYSPPIYVAR
ncbi:hypothetical protein [Paraburkholderia sp.]|uniref:hypothetical protein n=1 Tax=Paraburkholderia sp. TaxID=1926495 RepID=UPI002D7EFFBA|nr:hypothetical protein [Paraburkholderia sp.]